MERTEQPRRESRFNWSRLYHGSWSASYQHIGCAKAEWQQKLLLLSEIWLQGEAIQDKCKHPWWHSGWNVRHFSRYFSDILYKFSWYQTQFCLVIDFYNVCLDWKCNQVCLLEMVLLLQRLSCWMITTHDCQLASLVHLLKGQSQNCWASVPCTYLTHHYITSRCWAMWKAANHF